MSENNSGVPSLLFRGELDGDEIAALAPWELMRRIVADGGAAALRNNAAAEKSRRDAADFYLRGLERIDKAETRLSEMAASIAESRIRGIFAEASAASKEIDAERAKARYDALCAEIPGIAQAMPALVNLGALILTKKEVPKAVSLAQLLFDSVGPDQARAYFAKGLAQIDKIEARNASIKEATAQAEPAGPAAAGAAGAAAAQEGETLEE